MSSLVLSPVKTRAACLSFRELTFEGNQIAIADSGNVIATLTGVDTTTLMASDFV